MYKQKTTNILTKHGLPIKSDLTGKGKQCRSNNDSPPNFCVLYFILSEFLTKDVLERIVNPTYLIGCCDFTLINLVHKTIVLMFNTTHKMGCCEYCY